MRTRNRIITSVAVASLTVGGGGLLFAPAQAETTGANAVLSVLHGVPGLTVDVWVNGERTLDDFTPGTLAGPLDLPAGTYTVAITAADAVDASAPAIGPVDLPLEAGMNYTAVAHLDASGTPTATLFTNDISATSPGEGRVTVRHVAAAPAVDVLADGTAVISGLENPAEKVLDLPASTLSVAVAAAGTTDPVLGPVDVSVGEGVNTIAYAWGSLEDGTLALATQTIDGLHSAPTAIQAGQVGLAATGFTSDGASPWIVVSAGLALLAAAAGVLLTVRRSRARI